MASLSELRQKYPEYNDMSDKAFADAFYNKFYSDIPKVDFYKKLGFVGEESKPEGQKQNVEKPASGWDSVLEDVGKSISGVPSAVAEIAMALPGQIYEGGKQFVTNTPRALENVGLGLIQGIQGLTETPANIAEYLKSKGIGNRKIEDFISRNTSRENYFIDALKKHLGQDQPGDVVFRGAGSFLPYGAVGGVEKGLSGMLKRSGAAAAYGVGQNQDPVQSAIVGSLMERVSQVAPKVLSKETFLPRSELSVPELQKALQATAGTKTNLGDVLENSGLKKHYENIVAQIPFSGATETMAKTAKKIQNKGESILYRLNPDLDMSGLPVAVQEGLKRAEIETSNQKKLKFDKLNKEAENSGFTHKRKDFHEAINEEIKNLNKDPMLADLADKKLVSLLKKYSKYDQEKMYDLESSDYLRSHLREEAIDASLNNQKNKSRIYTKLKTALDNDINTSISNSGNAKLKALRDDAMDFYRKEWVPFEDPNIAKFTKQGGDPDTIMSAFIKNTKLGERNILLEKLTDKLDVDTKNKLANMYFSNAITDEKFDPLKFRTLFKNLGTGQRSSLLGHNKNLLKEAESYSNLVKKNTAALTQMVNPKTGATLSTVPWITALAGALASGEPKGALAGLSIPAYGRAANIALTNEALRNTIVKQLIKSKQKVPSKSNLSAFVQALTTSVRKKDETDRE